MSIFYSKVSDNVQAVLNIRKRISSRYQRNSSDHAWLYRKMSYVTAFAENLNSVPVRSNSLTTPVNGGFGKDSLYTSNENAKFVPKPHVNAFKTYSDGDWGSLQKCELTFTVYTLIDLDAYQAFFDLGASLVVEYGWSAGGEAAGRPGKFEGLIYNFSYSVRPDGGFNCTTYAISKGSVVLPVNITAGTNLNSETKDNLGQIIDSVTIIDAIQSNANSHTLYRGAIDLNNGIGYDYINTNVNLESTNVNLSGTAIKQKSNQEYYISLESLISLINKHLLNFSNNDSLEKTLAKESSDKIKQNYPDGYDISVKLPKPGPTDSWEKQNVPSHLLTQSSTTSTTTASDINIICNEIYTRGVMPKNQKDLLSGNPLEVIFPGFATYGNVTYFKDATEYNEKFLNGDLSKTLLNFNWVKKIFNSIGQETQDRQKSADQSITKFLLIIFNSISDNSGTRFKLSLTSDPTNSSRFIISDINYIDSKVTPYIITAVNNESISRNISLVSKVPNAMQTVAFVSGRSAKTTPSTSTGEVLNNKKFPAETEKINSLRASVQNIATLVGNTEGASSENVRRLQSALKELFEFTPFNSTYTKSRTGIAEQSALPFPIDFSVTLDGINGFVFGNTITTNYLPAVYKNTRVSFTITKLEHVVQNNDWTTTISTICRVFPDDVEEPYNYNYTGADNNTPASVGTYGVTPTTN